MTTWNVAPRYSAGSPAMVDYATAHRVAAQEQEAIQWYLDGSLGEVARDKAQRLGLGGIAWASYERHGFVTNVDLITGERVAEQEEVWIT